MKVLTIYANRNPRSFCHAVLERFCEGLRDAGHSNEVVDLHAIGFDPVFREADGPNWVDDSVPDDVLAYKNVQKTLTEAAGGPIRRFLLKRWMGGLETIRKERRHYPVPRHRRSGRPPRSRAHPGA